MYKKYHSGYFTSDYPLFPKPPYVGKFFIFTYGSKDFSHTTFDIERKKEIPGREIIIESNSMENAIKASKLILASKILLDSSIDFIDEIPIVKPFSNNKNLPNDIFNFGRSEKFHCYQLPLACLIASKLSFRRKYYYSLFKYKTACELFSMPPIEYDPHHSEYYKISAFIDDKIRLAQNIILFYSIIEELGLEIRLKNEVYSHKAGNWNPIVKQDLEQRLRKSYINLSEMINWDLRSTPTRIEKELKRLGKLNLSGKAMWAYGYARDSNIKIEDAILLASFMRSRIASHKLDKKGNLIRSLSVYDVGNINHLARRLLLEKLGFWKYC